MIKVSITGMVVSLKTDLRFPIPGQRGHGDRIIHLLGGTIKEMMEAEMDNHLGYEKSERSDNDDYRNGYKRKQVNSRYGSMEIEVPQDRFCGLLWTCMYNYHNRWKRLYNGNPGT